MVVVTIVGVVVALAAPQIGNALANRRTNELALEVVRIVRVGRSASVGQGRAYLLQVDPATDELTLYRGMTNRCTPRASWNAITSAGCEGNPRCAAYAEAPVVGDSTYDFQIDGADNPMDVCFEPTGITRWSTGGSAFTETHPNGGIQVNVRRVVGGSTAGVAKLVAIPFGADARVIR
jgi:Tfp pilus assembly protein FimT